MEKIERGVLEFKADADATWDANDMQFKFGALFEQFGPGKNGRTLEDFPVEVSR
jgi:hypothetical protein